jgi:hypothetical protein
MEKLKSPEEYLINGVEVYHVINGEEKWWVPSTNPFGHACCMCGVWHDVKYEIKNGIPEFLFVKNEEETKKHQSFILQHPKLYPDNLLSRLSKGKRAIELIKECNDYLNSLYGENSICSGSILHKKMKDYE